MTTIAYIGNFKHAFCTEVHLARELEGLGCTVQRFQEPSDPNQHVKFLTQFENWCYANKPAAAMFTRTWGLPSWTTDLWRRLETAGIVTFSYHLDLYVGLQREDGISNDPFWTTQFVFTPDGDPNSEQFFRQHAINHHWLSPAVVSDECTPGTPQDRYDYDVVFVGSENYHPEWPWRPALVKYLRLRYQNRFRRFAGDMPEGPTRGNDLNNLYATAKVVVGDSLCPPGHINYWTDRYFETVGRGGFLIAPVVPGIDQFLTPGEHFIGYQHPANQADFDDALNAIGDLVDLWLARPIEARQIALAGQEHIRNYHTYRHRLTQALNIMGIFPTDNTHHFISRLELGSGTHPTPGFTHLDINPNLPDVDIVGTAWPLDLPNGSVGEIRAVDVLEHLSYHDTDKVLADWSRVLTAGGTIYIQVPDAERIMKWYLEQPDLLVQRLPANIPQTPLSGAAWRLLGGHHDGVYTTKPDDWQWNAHYALFSADSLRTALERAGFGDIHMTSNAHPNLCVTAVKK